MKLNVSETKSFAEEVRRCTLRPISLEPDMANRLATENKRICEKLDYENREPMEQLMIEQVLTANTQNMVAMYQLENLPVNKDNQRQRTYLAERVHFTHLRLCRSMAMLTALRMVGPRLQFSENVPNQLNGRRPKPRKWAKKDIPPGHTHYVWEVGPDDPHWLDYKDPDARKEAIQRNEDLIKWRDFRAKCPEAFADEPPHKFVSVRIVSLPMKPD